MFTAPADRTDEQVLAVVRDHGEPAAEATYAGAAELAATLEFMHVPLPTITGRYTVPTGGRWLSVTRWSDGDRPDTCGDEATEFLRRLDAAPAPVGVLVWEPQVAGTLIDELRDWIAAPWTAGPHSEPARTAVRDNLPRIEHQLADYLELTGRLDQHSFVPTHGEPGVHNQWRSRRGDLLLIDWETLRTAPRERDLWALPDAVRGALQADPAMAGLFQLEWILSEVRSYSEWLRGPHADDQDTRTAIGGLRHELIRPAFSLR